MWWARTGSHKGPIPTSTSSPAPTIHGLGGPIRCIVGASGERMRGVGPCGRPSAVHSTPISLFAMYWPLWSPVRCQLDVLVVTVMLHLSEAHVRRLI